MISLPYPYSSLRLPLFRVSSMATSISTISGNCAGLYSLKARVRLCTIQLCREEEDSINQSPLGGVEAVGPLASSCEVCL